MKKGASAETAKGFMYTNPKPNGAKPGAKNTKKTPKPKLPKGGKM